MFTSRFLMFCNHLRPAAFVLQLLAEPISDPGSGLKTRAIFVLTSILLTRGRLGFQPDRGQETR